MEWTNLFESCKSCGKYNKHRSVKAEMFNYTQLPVNGHLSFSCAICAKMHIVVFQDLAFYKYHALMRA